MVTTTAFYPILPASVLSANYLPGALCRRAKQAFLKPELCNLEYIIAVVR